MAHRLIEIKARDGISIPCGVWDSDGEIVLYMHGIESHMGWFEVMADRLQERNFCVYAFVRRGSGLSKEERGHINSYKILINDINDVIKCIRESHPRKRLYLMGICGGGRFAADFAGYNPASIDGLILISPAIKTKVTLPLTDKVDCLFSSFLNPKKKISTPLREDMFTKNEKFINFIRNDALSLHHLTARFYRELILMDVVLSKKIFNVDIPVLTVLAEDDAIVNNDALMKWHKRLRSRDKTLKLFSGCCHFLPFQENISEIVDFIGGWIKDRRASN